MTFEHSRDNPRARKQIGAHEPFFPDFRMDFFDFSLDFSNQTALVPKISDYLSRQKIFIFGHFSLQFSFSSPNSVSLPST